MSRPGRRMLHTSDVHLGAHDFGDEARRTELHDVFRRVVDLALSERVDFMVVAGDFVDSKFVRDETLRFAQEQIARFGRPTVVVAGNHDHGGPGSVYDRVDAAALAPNLLLLRSEQREVVDLNGLDVEVWGRGHPEPSNGFAPFGSVPPRGDAPWQIAVGHGHFVAPGRSSGASYRFGRDDLARTRRDYVALGHWQHMTRVPAGPEVVAAYCGAPHHSGGGALVVDLREDGAVRLTGHSLSGGAPVPHDDIPYALYE